MFKSMLPNVGFKTNNKIDYLAGGENTFNPPLEIKDSQYTKSLNLSSRKYPAMSVRHGRQHFATAITTPNGMGQRNNQYLHVLDGKVWKYWNGASWTTVYTFSNDALGSFEEFSTGTTKYIICANGVDAPVAWNGSATTVLTNAPISRIFTTHKGRIFWARDNDIVFSALNLINDYTSLSGGGTIDVTRAKGALVSIYRYNNRVIVWDSFSMHELYGTDSTTFELVDIEGDIGCVSDKSVTICNKRLYWMFGDGVYEYTGSVPVKVSEPFPGNGVDGGVTSYINNINWTYQSKITSGAIGDYLYISIPYNGATTNNLILFFDTKLRTWFIHDGAFVNFENIGNVFYGIDTAGQIWNMQSGTDDNGTAISWQLDSKAWNDGAVSQKKVISNLWVTCDVPIGSTMAIYSSQTIDNEDFVKLYDFVPNADEQNTRVIVPVTKLQNIDYYRLRFSGTGQSFIHYIEKIIRIKQR